MAPSQMQAMLLEAMAKTKISITGIVKSTDVRMAGNGKTYGTLYLDVQGSTEAVKIKLGENPDISPYNLYELITIQCCVKPSFDRKSAEICIL